MSYICGIYDKRPKFCKEYPQQDHYQPKSCGYFFPGNGERRGKCLEVCDASCCKLPRRNGEPGEAALPTIAGGLPCKHLRYVEKADFTAPEVTISVGGDIREVPLQSLE